MSAVGQGGVVRPGDPGRVDSRTARTARPTASDTPRPPGRAA